jgi:hypothetical protein
MHWYKPVEFEHDYWFMGIGSEWCGVRDIPAWSLHRLIEIVSHTKYPYYVISKELPIYDSLCERIEWLIKDGYFNKEYLEEQAGSSREE